MSLRVLIILLVSACSLTACDQTSSAADAPAYTISVDGMTCDSCVAAVTQAIKGVDGVVDCEVSLEDGRAIVHAEDPEAADRVVAAINGLEFDAARLDDDDQQDG